MMKRRFLTTVAAVLSLALMVGCSTSTSSPSPTTSPSQPAPAPAPKTPVKLKVAVSGYDAYLLMTPIHVAVDKGYFTAENLDVEITTTGGGGDTMRAATTGGMDIAIGGADAAISAIVKEQPITIVAPYWQTTDNAWIVPGDSPIQTIKDLEGKKVGFTSPGSATEFMLQQAIAAEGLKNVQLIATGGEGATWAAVKSGQIDVAWNIEPILTKRLTEDGARVVWYAQKYVPHFMMDAIVVRNDLMTKEPEAIRGFLRALIKGKELTLNNPEEAALSATKVLKVPTEILVQGLKTEPNREVGISFKVDPLAFKTIEEAMVAKKTLPGPIADWSKVFNQSFLPAELRAEVK